MNLTIDQARQIIPLTGNMTGSRRDMLTEAQRRDRALRALGIEAPERMSRSDKARLHQLARDTLRAAGHTGEF